MYDYKDDIISALRRELEGKPPLEEITLPADSLMTPEELVKEIIGVYNAKTKTKKRLLRRTR